MSVFYDIHEDGTLLGIQSNEEEIIKDKQLHFLDFLHLLLVCTFCLGTLQFVHQLLRIGIQCPDAVLACFASVAGCEIALANTRRTCYDYVLVVTYEVE